MLVLASHVREYTVYTCISTIDAITKLTPNMTSSKKVNKIIKKQIIDSNGI